MKNWIRLLLPFMAAWTLSACNNADTSSSAQQPASSGAVTSAPAVEASQVAAPAAQDTSWSSVQQSGELRVGLSAAYPPFESRNEQTGNIEGFDVDLANALAQKLGIKVKVIDADWQALLAGLNKGDYDVLITCMSKKEASTGNVNMSDVYYQLRDIIVVRQDETAIKGKGDLAGKVVGVQLGSGSEQSAETVAGIKEIRKYNYNPEAFLDLKSKRIDAVIVSYAYALEQVKKDKDFRILPDTIDAADIVMVNKAQGNALTEKLNQALAAVKQDGTYDALIKKWLTVEAR